MVGAQTRAQMEDRNTCDLVSRCLYLAVWFYTNPLTAPVLSFSSGKAKTLRWTNPSAFPFKICKASRTGPGHALPPPNMAAVQGDSDLYHSGSHYSQGSRRNTPIPCGAEHMAWLKKCSPAQRTEHVPETKTAGWSQASQQNHLPLGSAWAQIMSGLSVAAGAVATPFPLSDASPNPSPATCFFCEISNCLQLSYWIMNTPASAYHQTFSRPPGELRRDG